MVNNPYGISKITAELLTWQYYINFGIEIVNIRIFNFFLEKIFNLWEPFKIFFFFYLINTFFY